MAQQGRAFRATSGSRAYWVAAERREVAAQLSIFHSGSATADYLSAEVPTPEALWNIPPQFAGVTVVRGWVEVNGPLTASGLAQILGFETSDVRTALLHLEGEGLVLRGLFTCPPKSKKHSGNWWLPGM